MNFSKAERRKKPTLLQILAMEGIEKAGGKCLVVYDYDTQDELERWILDARNTKGAGSRT